MNNRNLFLIVLAAGSLSLRCQHGQALVRALFLLCLHMAGRELESSLGSLFLRALIPFITSLLSSLNHLPKVLPPNTSHWELGCQHINSGGTQTFSLYEKEIEKIKYISMMSYDEKYHQAMG